MDQRSRPFTPLASLTKALARISRARTRDEVVETIRTSARSLIGCQGISIILKEGSLCHYVEEDAIGPLWKGQKFPASTCISGWSMINRKTAVVPDIAQDERIPQELYGGTFVRSLAMAPVRVDAPVAAIGAYWSQPYAPDLWEVETLEALAEAAAAALENADLIAELKVRQAHSRPPEDGAAAEDFAETIEKLAGIAAVPTILDVVLRMTGMGFAAVARVTHSRWVACQVLDPLGFGLKPGDELPIESTLCNEIRSHRQTVVFDDAAEDAQYCDHHTPRIYGLRSYISEPIILAGGQFWGTLCAIDPNPAKVNNPEVLGAFKLFAELIAHHLDAEASLRSTNALLERERELAELREQFIAVLGHDLRNPIAALDAGTDRLLKEGWTKRSPLVLKLMKSSISRMTGLVENVMDLARARMGGGITLAVTADDLGATLQHVVDEMRMAHPGREISAAFDLPATVAADHLRLAQMASNLLSNAIIHGSDRMPVRIAGVLAAGGLTIRVVNGGRPIPPEQIDKLFQPFKRGGGIAGSKGLGLGLYIASQIAQAHDGRIEVHSDADETCFTFSMPISMPLNG
ncbi:sensor histidine kinase [Azospirillum picis]|uniref:histidine kinase n=1 Tax=Azospirillum picis TaxID=488438 RepID=A0ABU0MNX6_9PROT|nr:GAF domain-containing sensor histidine kinase [Azospirillum picis]MBP2301181.1 signal transduction histidine kinase [Azospirillum picis]MDQ0534856.1 signal transduction histidine kinase [Azospirillum picis]